MCLQETRRSLADALKLALHYLQEQYTSLDDNHAHALALTAYAFTITGTSFSSVSVNKLNAIAHIDGIIDKIRISPVVELGLQIS